MVEKKFICIFPEGENIHLIKDVGMIPFFLQKEGYFKSSIAFYEDKKKLEYLNSEVAGISYLQIQKHFKNESLNVFLFLSKRLFSYNVVMMFHPSFSKIFVAFLIKSLSFNRVKFYFKYDVGEEILNVDFKNFSFKNKLSKFFYSKVDLFTVETKKINNFLNKESYIKTKYLPNGFYKKNNNLVIEKQNILLTVGRIGTYQKDTETFLKAISIIDLKTWRVEIVGNIEEDFKSYIDKFYKDNANLKDKVLFKGSMSDKESLDQKYAESKVFVLSSRFESFGLVLVESLSFGCYIVSTDLIPARDITNDGQYGTLFPVEDVKELASILQEIINGKQIIPKIDDMIDYADSNFRWENIVANLNYYLK